MCPEKNLTKSKHENDPDNTTQLNEYEQHSIRKGIHISLQQWKQTTFSLLPVYMYKKTIELNSRLQVHNFNYNRYRKWTHHREKHINTKFYTSIRTLIAHAYVYKLNKSEKYSFCVVSLNWENAFNNKF